MEGSGTMQFFSIGIEEHDRDIKELILKKLKKRDLQGLVIDEKNAGNMTFINIRKEDHSKYALISREKEELSCFISDILSDMVVDDLQNKMMEKIIEDDYFYFTKEEREKILLESTNIMWGGNPTIRPEIIRNGWRNRIYKRLNEHFEAYNELALGGFIRFRLKDFLKEMEDAISQAVDDLLIEKEYNEFIKLLRYFVEIQEPKIEEVHVMLDDDKRYTLLDSSFRVINNDVLEDLAREISDKEISYDDLLISSLITIAPNKITIHECQKIKNTELLNTIKNVFYGKVVMSHEGIVPR